MKITISLLFILILSVVAFGQTSPPPDPQLIYTGSQDIESNGREWTVYRLDVSNRAEYPDELFEPAPDLPPCGRNQNSSRSWVNIYSGKGRQIYGFCALKSAAELNTLAFQMPRGKVPDGGVYIIIVDRKTRTLYKSSTIRID